MNETTIVLGPSIILATSTLTLSDVPLRNASNHVTNAENEVEALLFALGNEIPPSHSAGDPFTVWSLNWKDNDENSDKFAQGTTCFEFNNTAAR